MMTSSISGDNSWLYPLLQTNSANGTNPTTSASSGGAYTDQAAPSQRGHFVNAIIAALSQSGIGSGADPSGTASTSSAGASGAASPAQDPSQALGTFLQSLVQALHSQDPASTSQSGTDRDRDNDGGGVAGVEGKHHHHHLQTEMQSLISQLSSTSRSPSSGTSPSGSSTTGSGTTDPLQALGQSYQSLLGALGKSGNAPTLSNFLQTVATNMQDGSSLGSVVSATA